MNIIGARLQREAMNATFREGGGKQRRVRTDDKVGGAPKTYVRGGRSRRPRAREGRVGGGERKGGVTCPWRLWGKRRREGGRDRKPSVPADRPGAPFPPARPGPTSRGLSPICSRSPFRDDDGDGAAAAAAAEGGWPGGAEAALPSAIFGRPTGGGGKWGSGLGGRARRLHPLRRRTQPSLSAGGGGGRERSQG